MFCVYNTGIDMTGYNFIKIFAFITLLYLEGFLWARICRLYSFDSFVWAVGCVILAIVSIAIVSYMEKKGKRVSTQSK